MANLYFTGENFVQVATLQGRAAEQAMDMWLNSPSCLRLLNIAVLYEAEFGPMSPALKKLLLGVDQIPPSRPGVQSVVKEVSQPGRVEIPRPDAAAFPPPAAAFTPPAAAFTPPAAAFPPLTAKCTECDMTPPTLLALKRHFVFNLPPNQKQFICQGCSAVYFSLCSFSAHKRTHLKVMDKQTPYTCPECGAQVVCQWRSQRGRDSQRCKNVAGVSAPRPPS